MNIKILDSWLRDYLKTKATPQKIAEVLSLTSVSVERIERFKDDFIYDIEVTTNGPDLMSVTGIAREAATALSQNAIPADFIPQVYKPEESVKEQVNLTVTNIIPHLVHRVCAVVLDIRIKESPQFIKDRLESSGIRSLNNVIDITNYVMRVTGHPTHVFDYDRIQNQLIMIRESKKGEKITTLDGKTYILPGGDIIAEDGKGRIIDLLAIMGLENSVVTDQTKRIIYFIDNNEPSRIRTSSMSLAIRTEAAQLEEKGVDPELAKDALLLGIELFGSLADGKIVKNSIDIYPHPVKTETVVLKEEKLQTVLGIPIQLEQAAEILEKLAFIVKINNTSLTANVPSFRSRDVTIPEDLIEEVARMYGYQNIPSALAPLETNFISDFENTFYWEQRLKNALKYWGFIEVYTYSMVSEQMFENDLNSAVTIKNHLSEDLIYMRNTLIPSLLKTIGDNPLYDEIKIFEIANVYLKRKNGLPEEQLRFAGIIKKAAISFYEVKGLFEQIAADFGIAELHFTAAEQNSVEMHIGMDYLGNIELFDNNLINFECIFSVLVKHASLKKRYIPIPKHPPIIEDMTFVLNGSFTVGKLIEIIKKQSKLLTKVALFDKYQNTRTFRINYQDPEKNLTNEDVSPIREKIIKTLKEKGVSIK